MENFGQPQSAFIAPQLILLSMTFCTMLKVWNFVKDLSCVIVTALNFSLYVKLNYLVLLGKWFLNYNKKSAKCPIFFKEYLHFIETKLEVLYLLHQKERNIENFTEIYLDFLNLLQKL